MVMASSGSSMIRLSVPGRRNEGSNIHMRRTVGSIDNVRAYGRCRRVDLRPVCAHKFVSPPACGRARCAEQARAGAPMQGSQPEKTY
jgi:hypothetical protein